MHHESSYLLQAFEETPTHMSIKINRLEEGHNLYQLVCQRHAETVSPKGDKYVIDEELQHTYMTVPYVDKVNSVQTRGVSQPR